MISALTSRCQGTYTYQFFGAIALATLAASGALAQQASEITGEEIDKPLHRFDLRVEYQRPDSGVNQWTTTLRYDRPFYLADGWKLGLRVDAPFVTNNAKSQDNPNGRMRAGAGDMLFQAGLSKMIDDQDGFGFALRVTAPTASADQFGSGQWRLLPTVGYRRGLLQISNGSYFQPVVRYQFDVAGEPARSHVSVLQFAPSVNIALAGDWYVTYFPSTDLRYNFIRKQWFVPFNIEIGKEWGRYIASLELAAPIYYQGDPVYLFKTEGRITVLF